MPEAAAATGGLALAAGGRADALLHGLEWQVIRRLDGLLPGSHRTRARGSGMDFVDLRAWQDHDDVRHIDWNVTARAGAPHVRLFAEERDLSAWFLLDLSASMDFGSARSKRETLVQWVAVLGRLLQRGGNRIGAMLHHGDGRHSVLPARSSRSHLLQILHRLLHPADGDSPPAGITPLAQLLRRAQGVLRQRSALFVVSDFLSTPGWERSLGQLAQRHDVLAVRVLDALEREIPDVGLVHLQDVESGEQIEVDTHARAFRQRFAQLAAQRDAQLQASLARAGVDALELDTGGDLVQALMRLVQLRKQVSFGK